MGCQLPHQLTEKENHLCADENYTPETNIVFQLATTTNFRDKCKVFALSENLLPPLKNLCFKLLDPPPPSPGKSQLALPA